MKRWLDRVRATYWEWRDATLAPPQRLPTVLQFPVNDICNSHCQMCHIWQRKRDHEITPDELAAALRSPVFREVREAGINGGEPTLRRDLPVLVERLIAGLPRLRGLSLITNAVQAKVVKGAVDEVGRQCRDAGVHFDVMVSLDGVGAVHDAVRGVRGNFTAAEDVLDYVRQHANVSSCRIGCTVIRENVYAVEDVLEFARRKEVYARFRVGIPHPRLYTDQITQPFALDDDERYHLVSFLDYLRLDYETEPGRRAFYRSLRDQIAYGAHRTAGCAWKNRGVTLTSRGDLAYCAVRSPILGAVQAADPNRLFWDNAPVLRQIVANECADCRHDYEGLGNRSLFWERRMRRVLARLPAGNPVSSGMRRAKSAIADARAGRTARALARQGASVRDRPAGILLCGWYGTETLGDKAILAGLRKSLADTGWTGPVDLASLEPYVSEQTRRELPDLDLRSVLTMAAAQNGIAAGDYRAVVIAGGPLMSPVREVYDLLALFSAAVGAGATRAILGCGVGPLGHSRRRDAVIAELLAASQHTVLRDRRSLELARSELGTAETAEVAADPALIWAYDQSEGSPVERDGPVLLALREWQTAEYARGQSFDEAQKRKARFERELLVMVEEVRRLMPEWSLRPLPMHTLARGGDDRVFFHRLFASRPELLQALPWRRSRPAADFRLFRTAPVVLAMRFHSVVFATAARAPCVAIDYTGGGKTAAFLESVPGAAPPIDITQFDGRACAERMIAQAGLPPPAPPRQVREAYAAAWQRVLALSDVAP